MTSFKIYYDGLCHLCSREIDLYKKLPEAPNFEFIDITSSDFNAQKEGLDPYLVHKKMHVRLPDGRVLTGVDGFLEIWKRFKSYRKLVPVVGNPIIKPLAKIGYFIFARLRVYLPKRKRHDCSQSPYCERK